MIVLINYNMGNLGSISNMLKKIGAAVQVSSSPEDILRADRLILPGIGAFDSGMQNLDALGLLPALGHQVLEKKIPILGICLGLQLFAQKSEEGSSAGLGWLEAEVLRFQFPRGYDHLKIPHMGWNQVKIIKASPLFSDFFPEPRFYFVHSYHLVCRQEADILARTNYGFDFVSVVEKENITGVQFHPEKSHRFGMKFLQNWVRG